MSSSLLLGFFLIPRGSKHGFESFSQVFPHAWRLSSGSQYMFKSFAKAFPHTERLRSSVKVQ